MTSALERLIGEPGSARRIANDLAREKRRIKEKMCTLQTKDYTKALHRAVVEYGIDLVTSVVQEDFANHLQSVGVALECYTESRERALSQPRDAVTGRFV